MPDDEENPLKDIGIGVACIAAGIALYFWMAYIDRQLAQQSDVRVHWLGALLYKTLGKWGSLGGFSAFGLFMIACGVHTFKKQNAPANTCTKCGYDLTDNKSGACPECGKVL